MSETPFVDAMLYGYFPTDFVHDGKVHVTVEEIGAVAAPPEVTGSTRIRDARVLQEKEGQGASFSEARFFDEHGFVLLEHQSEFRDWDADPSLLEAFRLYHGEAEDLIRTRLLPGRRLEVYQGPPGRRGPGTVNPFYATGVHQDYGPEADDYEESLLAFATPEIAGWWRERFDRDDVEGFLMVNLWRPVHLDGPLRHMPLAVCEPSSVRVEDCVPLALEGITPTGRPTSQLGLRHRGTQRWFYYPGMTRDEVLAFKNFQLFKEAGAPRVEACFHSAFEDPAAPADCPERQSSEHRVSVFVLAD